jgi:hypothetical protein
MSHPRPGATAALVLATMLTIGSAIGCGSGGKHGAASQDSRAAAPTAKADAAVVTYYYLPG